MKYSILAAFAESIPYIPGLRELTGSSSSAILMMQLEYWFSRYPEGFYKFLEPPQKSHNDYTHGDSWTEELAFGKEEFRAAFDKIGNRFNSKTQYEEAKQSDQEFGEKFYSSYFDRQSGLTYYHRDHERLNEFISRVQPRHKGIGKKSRKKTSQPQSQDSDHVVNSDLREMVNSDLREVVISHMTISEDPIYGSGNFRFTDPYIYSEITPEITSEIKIKTPLTPQGESEWGGIQDEAVLISNEVQGKELTEDFATQQSQKENHRPEQNLNPVIRHSAAVESDPRFLPTDTTAENMATWKQIVATGAMRGERQPDPGFLEFYRAVLSGCTHYKGKDCNANHAKAALSRLWKTEPLKVLAEAESWVKSKTSTSTQTRDAMSIPREERLALARAIQERKQAQQAKRA